MNYSTRDAIDAWQSIKMDLLSHGPDVAFTNARDNYDTELLAMTLTLCIQSTYPLPPN